MESRPVRHPVGALLLLAAMACATVQPQDPGGPLDGPLPPGTYELTANVTYRVDSDQMRHEAHASYHARLYVTWDGTIELYSGEDRCVDPFTLPGRRDRRPWQGAHPGHHFDCGDAGWTLWADHDGVLHARVSASVTEMVQSRMQCLQWNYDSGRPVCEKYGVVVNPRSRSVTAAAGVEKVGG